MKAVLLKGSSIDNAALSCTGEQLSIVIRTLAAMPELSGCRWYAGALSSIGGGSIAPYDKKQAKCVQNISALIEQIKPAPQLLDGVIIAMPAHEKQEFLPQILTADGPLEQQITGSILELLVFDTSTIDIISQNESIIDYLFDRFGGHIENIKAT